MSNVYIVSESTSDAISLTVTPDPEIETVEVGTQGPVGPGVAAGGSTGQFLKKSSATNYETEWASPTKSDVGLGNVDNTSDANKPVSTAQQAALDLKANLASPALTGIPTAPTASASTNSTQLASTAFVQARGNILPNGVTLDMVNRIRADMRVDGLMMHIPDTTVTAYRNIAGGFNGSGRGNKGFINLNDFTGISFGNLTSLKFIAKLLNGASNLMFF